MVLLAYFNSLSTAKLSLRQEGHLLNQETKRQQHLTTWEFNSQETVLHPNVADPGAVQLLRRRLFGSTQWLKAVQLPKNRLLSLFPQVTVKGSQCQFKAVIVSGPQTRFWFVNSSSHFPANGEV